MDFMNEYGLHGRHVEFTCFDKKNEAPRMQRKGVRTGRSAFVGEAEIEEDDFCGHGEAVVAEIREGNVGDIDDAKKGFLFDDGSSHHSSGQKSHFKTLEDIPHEVIMHHLAGSVRVKQWGTIELNTDGECGGVTLQA